MITADRITIKSLYFGIMRTGTSKLSIVGIKIVCFTHIFMFRNFKFLIQRTWLLAKHFIAYVYMCVCVNVCRSQFSIGHSKFCSKVIFITIEFSTFRLFVVTKAILCDRRRKYPKGVKILVLRYDYNITKNWLAFYLILLLCNAQFMSSIKKNNNKKLHLAHSLHYYLAISWQLVAHLSEFLIEIAQSMNFLISWICKICHQKCHFCAKKNQTFSSEVQKNKCKILYGKNVMQILLHLKWTWYS